MKRKIIFLCWLSALLIGPATRAADAEKTYAAPEAKAHVGETATVTGMVDGIKVLGSGMILMNIDGRYPDQALTVVVREADVAAVGDVSGYDGKKIRVHGAITEYKGGAQIEIKTKDAISLAQP